MNVSGESALYFACLNGHVNCVRILLDNGCHVSENITNEVICQNCNKGGNGNDELKEEKKRAILSLLGR